jgi:hypothetical protein
MTSLLVSRRRPQEEPAKGAVHEWVRPGGGIAARFFREPEGYLLRFPDIADFEVDAQGRAATCFPAPAAAEADCFRVYQHNVMPLMLSLRGALVLHASAVEVSGRAIAFAGQSGAGKSTLAASFVVAGHGFLSDDAVMIEANCGMAIAHPSPRELRLWPDSLAWLVRADHEGRLECAESHHLDTPCVLERLFVLDPGGSDEPRVEAMSGAEAFIQLMRHAFHVDPADRGRGALHFDSLAAAARSSRLAWLRYPRRYDVLAALRELATPALAAESAPS